MTVITVVDNPSYCPELSNRAPLNRHFDVKRYIQVIKLLRFP